MKKSMISGKKFVKFGRNTIEAVTCNFELLSKYQVDLVALLASFWMVGTLVKKFELQAFVTKAFVI